MPSPAASVRTATLCATLALATAGTGFALASEDSPAPGSAAAGPFVSGHVLVRYAAEASAADQAALEHASGASRIGGIDDLGVDVLEVPTGAEGRVIEALQHSGKVEFAELDGVVTGTEVTPDDPYWTQEWGQPKVGAPSVWDTTTGDASVVIAQLDSGVDYAHPDLQGRFVAGYDFVNADATPADDYGHGTKAAGVLGARSNNGAGVAAYCWGCSVMPIKVLDSAGSGSYANLINGITWATDHGARVISMSVVGGTDSSALRSAVQYAYDHGVVIVGAAGNAGNTTPTFPGSYPEVLSVAGSTSSDALYSWSTYGAWVDVAAPGCTTTTVLGGSYGSFCGTSSATPAAAGAVGLLLSARPEASNADVMGAVEKTAVSMGSQVAYGRINAASALASLSSGADTTPSPTESAAPVPSPSPTTSTTTVTYSGSITAKSQSRSFTVSTGSGSLDATVAFTKGGPLSVTIADASGAEVASAAGGSPVHTSAQVTAGSYVIKVSGTTRTSFSLNLTTPTP